MGFCASCGYTLTGNENFCPSCGNKSVNGNNFNQSKKTFSYEFSSKLILGGNVFTPDRLNINQDGVTFLKRNKYLIGVDRSFLSFSDISYVKVDRRLISSTVIISSKGARGIRAENFSISDAKKIEKIIRDNR
ncbi:zinc ribbon domain-containing protein [Polaribacter sp.]|nr:zinc ribbon domain-containing protein [Polaribacter sp.]